MPAAAPDLLRQGVLYRCSQLITAEELQSLELQAVLDLRTAKRSCKQLEKHELTSQSRPSPDSSTKQRLRTRHRARHKADGHTCKSCKDCSLAYSRKYDTDVPVYHADLLPLKTGLKIMSSVPLRTSSAALMRVLCCQHPQKTMAPAVADEDTLGLGRLYIIIIDESPKQVARAMRMFLPASNLPILIQCVHGKDRTGLIIMLLLLLLDVPLEDVVSDYVKSELALVERQGHGELDLEEHLTKDKMLRSRRGQALQLHDHLQQRWGGAREYLLSTGLSPQELASIRSNLLQRPDRDDVAAAKSAG